MAPLTLGGLLFCDVISWGIYKNNWRRGEQSLVNMLSPANDLEKLSYGDHICFMFNNIQEYRDVAVKFIADGLLKNEKVLFVIDEYPVELLEKDLREKDLAMDMFVSTGQLVISSNKNMYSPDFEFDPKESIRNWKLESRKIKKEGFAGYRAMGEMVFALNGKLDNLEKLMEYEVYVHQEVLMTYDRQINLCIFNKAKFPSFVLEDMIKKHNIIIDGMRVVKPNPYYEDFDMRVKHHQEKQALRQFFSIDKDSHCKLADTYCKEGSKDNEVLKQVLSITGDGTWEWDMTSPDIKISGNVSEITGSEKYDLYVDYCEAIKLIHPEDFCEFINTIDKCCINQMPYFSYEFRIQKKNGEWEWFIVKGIPVEKDVTNGRVQKLIGIFNNISAIKKTKIELEEKKYFEKLRNDFFANLSHELRTPLNVILSALQLQELYIGSEDSVNNMEKYKRQLKIMRMNGYRLLRLINNLIDITRIDAGFYSLDLQNYDIINLVKTIVFSLEDYISKQELQLEFCCDIERLEMACDPDKIERILLNLLSNAVKFTKKGGGLRVSIQRKDQDVMIIIADTGIGIPEEKLSSIFERFIQVENTLTRNHEGSGIGLSLVKAIAELHQGSVSVKSKVNKGSEFTVQLPIIRLEPEAMDRRKTQTSWTTNVERMNIEFSDIYSDS